MSKFVTEVIEEIKAREVVEQLVINGVKQLHLFEMELTSTTYFSEYRTILRYIEYVANGNSLPATKFRVLAGVTDGVKEYEFKSKHIRIYAIQQPSKKIVVFLGYKNSQPKDIVSFRSVKAQYLEDLKQINNEKKRSN